MGSVRSLIGLFLFKDTSKFCETGTEISHQLMVNLQRNPQQNVLALTVKVLDQGQIIAMLCGLLLSSLLLPSLIISVFKYTFLMLATKRKITSVSKCQAAVTSCHAGSLAITLSLQ